MVAVEFLRTLVLLNVRRRWNSQNLSDYMSTLLERRHRESIWRWRDVQGSKRCSFICCVNWHICNNYTDARNTFKLYFFLSLLQFQSGVAFWSSRIKHSACKINNDVVSISKQLLIPLRESWPMNFRDQATRFSEDYFRTLYTNTKLLIISSVFVTSSKSCTWPPT